MDNTEKFEKLKKVIKIYLPEDVSPEEITEDSSFLGQLNINSAHMVDIVLDVEEMYDIVLQNEDLEKMVTVRDAMDVIDKKLADKSAL